MVPRISGALVSNLFCGEQVLVTGAAGFIGRHLCHRLMELQATVVAVDCYTPDATEVLPGFIKMDIASYDELRAIDVVDPTLVFHLAAVGASDPFLPVDDALRANVLGTVNLLKVLDGRAPVAVARTAAERNPSSPYAASKAAAWGFCDMYARARGWPLRGAMIFQCYGAGQSGRNVLPAALAAAFSGDEFPLSPGEQLRDWVSVEDVVSGLLAVAQSELAPADSIEIGTGEGTSLRETVKILFELVGGKGRPIIGALPYRPGEDMRAVADADRTERLTGWRARTGLVEGLRALGSAGAS